METWPAICKIILNRRQKQWSTFFWLSPQCTISKSNLISLVPSYTFPILRDLYFDSGEPLVTTNLPSIQINLHVLIHIKVFFFFFVKDTHQGLLMILVALNISSPRSLLAWFNLLICHLSLGWLWHLANNGDRK